MTLQQKSSYALLPKAHFITGGTGDDNKRMAYLREYPVDEMNSFKIIDFNFLLSSRYRGATVANNSLFA